MVMGTLCHYLAQTMKEPAVPSTETVTVPAPAATEPTAVPTDDEETAPGEADLDAEAAGHS
jgi:hypothetical protein